MSCELDHSISYGIYIKNASIGSHMEAYTCVVKSIGRVMNVPLYSDSFTHSCQILQTI